MKKLILGALFMSLLEAKQPQTVPVQPNMPEAPDTVQTNKEIAITYNTALPKLYNSLSPQERVFAYYMYRAALPGNHILTDQLHRHGLEITNIFETVYLNIDKLDQVDFDITKFTSELKTYLVYLWANHGQYFEREMSEEKRTPARLNLNTLTKDNIIAALNSLSKTDEASRVEELAPYIFDATIEPTAVVPSSIEESACNIYSPDFTEEDYQKVSPEDRSQVNSYFYIDENKDPKVQVYSAKEKYSAELAVSLHWIKKAHDLASKNVKFFDAHLVKSLEYLIKFIETGDEKLFKKHSIHWLRSDSRIDYCFGFIETYKDPKSLRGSFQGEVTIKSVDIKKLTAMLPEIEKNLPVPTKFMRDNLEGDEATVPNASINSLIFGAGELGPAKIVAAYCLPNYAEIRSEHGSKQIIYPSTKDIGAKLNPELSRRLFNSKKHTKWLNKVDPYMELSNDIWDLQCILHETLGHGSGKLTTHTFAEGENLTIEGVTHNAGDTIPVTSGNIAELLEGYEQTLEELRAEIIALYVSVHHLDKLVANGFMTRWAEEMSLKNLQKYLVRGMAGMGLKRLIQQNDNAKEIAGDHARANCTIMHYLLDKGGIEIHRELYSVNNNPHMVTDLNVTDLNKAKENIKNLMVLVQTIKSTGDGLSAKHLIETYGVPLHHPQDLRHLKANHRAISGEIREVASIFPHFIPIKDENGEITDIRTEWPKDFFEQQMHYRGLSPLE